MRELTVARDILDIIIEKAGETEPGVAFKVNVVMVSP